MVESQAFLYRHFIKDQKPITDFVAWLAQAHQLPAKLDLLDMGCGPGTLLPQYARLGWTVTGMEPDLDFYQASAQFAAEHPDIHMLKGGFQDLEAVEQYDLITAVNDPFAYLLDIPARMDALCRIYRALRPGGVFFMEIKNFLFKLRYHEPMTQEELEIDGKQVMHIMQHEIDFHHACWVHRDEYLVEGEDKIVTRTDRVAIITPAELQFYLQQQGFQDIQTYNSFEDRESEPISGRLILMSAVKP